MNADRLARWSSLILIVLFASCQNKYLGEKDGFKIAAGYNLQLVAKEPLTFDPVDIEFDEKGRAFVLEMPGYPYSDEKSRVIMLSDTDGDGVFDLREPVAKGLEMATSLMIYKEGILVAAPPYILWIREMNGAKVDTIMGGFATGNLQHNISGLTLGLDGWIYLANGGNDGRPFWWGDKETELDMNGMDLRFNMDTKDMQLIGESSGGFELAFDAYGRIFQTHNLEHVSHLVKHVDYFESIGNEAYNTLENISDHDQNGLARIYPIGEQETRVNHPEQSGYFSGACGVTWYGGGALDNLNATLWVADVVLNLIHIDRMVPEGSILSAERVYSEKDFLASTDRSFRPVNMSVGPEGAMYIVDMHRAVIEHPEWIPDPIEEGLDLYDGRFKGRIYKVISAEAQGYSGDIEGFTELSGLISSLGHPNQWTRMTAHRLLIDSNEDQIIDQLKSRLEDVNSYGRLHAMWILSVKNKLSNSELLSLLQDTDLGIVENALIVAEMDTNINSEVLSEMIALLAHENQRIRMMAAFSLSKVLGDKYDSHNEAINKAIEKSLGMPSDHWNYIGISLLAHHEPSQWIDQIISLQNKDAYNLLPYLSRLCANSEQCKPDKLFLAISEDGVSSEIFIKTLDEFRYSAHGTMDESELRPLFNRATAKNNLFELSAVGRLAQRLGLRLKDQQFNRAAEALERFHQADISQEEQLGILAVAELLPFDRKSDLLYSCLSNQMPLDIQRAALQQLGSQKEKEIGGVILSKWPELGPMSRKLAGDLLLFNEIHHDVLLTGLETGAINIGEMNFDLERRRTLLWWTDNLSTRKRAEKLFDDAGVVNRQEVIEAMAPALELRGNEDQGSQVFKELCAECHVFGSIGEQVGPVLSEISRKSKATLLHDILDPNAAVETRYINHLVKTRNGQSHLGIVENESASGVAIRKLGGELQVVQRADIVEFRSLGTSAMMEGLEANLSHQAMADLLAYLQSSPKS